MNIVGYLQENNLVYVELPRGSYQIAGKLIVLTEYSNETIIDADKINEVFIISSGSVLSHYKNVDTGDNITVSNYITQLQVVMRDATTDADGDSYFTDIRHRHAFELFTTVNVPVHNATQHESRVNINVVGKIFESHPFVIPMRKISGDLKNTLFSYNVEAHAVHVVNEVLADHGFTKCDDAQFGIGPSYSCSASSIQYAKIRIPEQTYQYLTILVPSIKQYENKFIMRDSDRAVLIEQYHKNANMIKNALMVVIYKAKQLTSIDEPTIGAISKSLIAVGDSLSKVVAMKRSMGDLNRARGELHKTIAAFAAAVAK